MDHAIASPAASPSFGAVWRRDAAAVAALLVLALVFGLPTLWVDYPDDAFYTEAAHLWTQGAPPYIGAFDIKPPGYFALLAAAQLLFGPTVAAIHALSLACDLAAAIAIYAIGRTLDAPRAGFAAAAAFIPLAVFLIENAAYPPLVLAETLAFWAALRPGAPVGRAALSGLACGAALALKQTAVLETAALAFVFARERHRSATLAFLAATAAAPLAFVAYYAALGALLPLFQDVVVHALQRPSIQGAAAGGLLHSKLLASGLVAALTICVGLRLRVPPAGLPPAHAAVLRLWTLAALVELLAQGANDLNYLSAVMVPALLLVCLYAERNLTTLATVVLATVAFVALVRVIGYRREVDDAAMRQIAALVAEAHPEPADRLLGLDFALWANVATDLAPPTPYFHRMHLLCAFPGAGPERLSEAFAARPRFVVLGARLRTKYDCAADSPGWATVDSEVGAYYRPLGDAEGKTGKYWVFERAR